MAHKSSSSRRSNARRRPRQQLVQWVIGVSYPVVALTVFALLFVASVYYEGGSAWSGEGGNCNGGEGDDGADHPHQFSLFNMLSDLGCPTGYNGSDNTVPSRLFAAALSLGSLFLLTIVLIGYRYVPSVAGRSAWVLLGTCAIIGTIGVAYFPTRVATTGHNVSHVVQSLGIIFMAVLAAVWWSRNPWVLVLTMVTVVMSLAYIAAFVLVRLPLVMTGGRGMPVVGTDAYAQLRAKRVRWVAPMQRVQWLVVVVLMSVIVGSLLYRTAQPLQRRNTVATRRAIFHPYRGATH